MSSSPILRIPNLPAGSTTGQTLRWDATKWEATSDLIVTDTGNVGIGTAAPIGTLEVKPEADVRLAILANSGEVRLSALNDAVGEIPIQYKGNAHSWLTGSAERMRIDSAGNVGIGLGGAAAQAPLNVEGGIALTRAGNESYISGGANGAFVYQQRGVAGGGVRWTSGDTTTEYMRITSTGNVGIGDTNPTRAKLSVKLTDTDESVYFYGGGLRGLQINDVTNSNAGDHTRFFKGSSSGLWSWSNSTREQMRLDASGNLLVGKTVAGLNTIGAQFEGATGVLTVTVPTGANSTLQCNRQEEGAGTILAAYTGGANAGSLYTNGTTLSIISASDSRLKEDVTDMAGELANVMALRPVDYTLMQNGERYRGFIAQEVQEVWPDKVSVQEDGMLALSGMGDTEARLIKAIQELNAKVDALT